MPVGPSAPSRLRDLASMPGFKLNDTIVLGYHAVSDEWPSLLAVRPKAFEAQVSRMIDRGYRGVTFHDAVHGKPVGKRFAVTFDDSYLSVLEGAFPVLSRLGVPATVFVPTDYVDGGKPMRWSGIEQWSDGPYAAELTPMSWDQLARLRDAGWEIGSHTQSHPHLTEIGDESLDAELQGSKRACEQHLGEPCRSLAYPYGDFDDRVVAAARRAEYSSACTLPARLRAPSPLRWPRVGIYPSDDEVWRFRAKTSAVVRAVRASFIWDAVEAARRRSGRASEVRRVAA